MHTSSFRFIAEFFSKLENIQILLVPFFIISEIFIFLWLYYFHKYLKEVDVHLSFWQIASNDVNKISRQVIEQKKNFFKKDNNPSPNKKLAKLFFNLMIITLLLAFMMPFFYIFYQPSM